jgi:hypothetical protein
MSLLTALSKPLPLVDGRRLETLLDAAQLIVDLPTDHQTKNQWQHAALLIERARESRKRADIVAATGQIELALFLSALLDLDPDKKLAGPSAKRRPATSLKRRQ